MARKKSTKKISPVVQQYNKERNRISRQLSRMLARGYIIPADALPPRPKKITKASVRRLQKITTKKLYDQSDFQDLVTGEVVSGREGRKIERKRSAEKAQATRKRRKHDEYMVEQGWRKREKEIEEQEAQEEEQEEWERERRRKDQADRERLERDAEWRRRLSEGQMIADQIESIIEDIEDTFSRDLASIVRRAWDNAQRGDKQVLYRRLAENPDVIDALKESYYQDRSGDHFRPTAFNKFLSIIQGSALSAEQMQANQDEYERRQALDSEIDEGITD